MRSRPARFAQGWILLALVIGSCNSFEPAATPSSPSAAFPSVAPSLFPATPTPTPVLILVGEADDVLVEALTQWASQHGWEMTQLVGEAVNAEELPSGTRAVVSTTALDTSSLTAARPDVIAVVVDQETSAPGPRVSTVGTPGARRDHAGFLAGVLAGSVRGAETLHMVSGTGGGWDGVYLGSFEHGVRYTCPKCTVIQLQAGDLASDGVGQQTGVLFVIPGPEAAIAASEAIALGALWIIWVGEAPEGVDPLRFAARVVFVRERLVVQALEALLNGEAGSAWPYAVENGGIQLSDVKPEAITPGHLRLAEEAYAQLASGVLDPGVDPATGAGP